MKQFSSLFVSVAAAAMALVSCQVEDSVIDNPSEEAVTIRVHASANELKSDDPATKTYIDNTNTIIWGTGEYMKLALTAGETTFATSTDASADTSNGQPSATFKFSVTPAAAASYTYQGIYPASATVDNKNHDNYKVNLPAIQNATASSYDPAAYIMVAKPETFTSVQTDWVASFRRGTALNKITLKNFASSVEINKVKITAEGKKLAGGRHFNLTTGEGLEVYGTDATIEVLYATPLSGTSMDVWFTSWDTEIAEDEKLTIVAYTTDNKSYTKEITVPTGKTIKFQEGYLNTLGAKMGDITPENVSTFADGDYVILAKKDDSNFYALRGEASGTRIASVNYNGSMTNYSGDASLIWTIAASGTGYTIKNGGNFIGWTSGNNADLVAEADYDATKCLMGIAENSDGTYKIYVIADASRMLARNTSNAYFAFYAGTQYKDIVFVPATSMAQVATPSFDPAAGAVASGSTVTISCTTPDATIHYTVDGTDPTSSSATYSSPITITAATTIKAIAVKEGMADSQVATATYSVSGGSGTDYYEKVTSALADWSGEYLMVCESENKALSEISNTSTKYGIGSDVSISGGKIESTTTVDAYKVTIAKATNSGTGYTLDLSGSYLAWSSGNSLSASASESDNSRWTITAGETSGNWIIANVADSAREIWYNTGSPRFACYTGKNESTAGYAAIQLYKLDNSSVPSVTWNLESISVTTAPAKTTYTEGESFDPAGMVVTGHFVDADDNTNTKDEAVTGYTITPDGALATTDTEVTITYQGKSATQAITVNAVPVTTIADVLAGGAGTYAVPDVLVYAVKGNALIIGDATGKMYAYKSDHGLSAGAVRTVNGTTKIYNEVYEFDGPDFTGTGTSAVNHGTAVDFDSQASVLQSAFANPSTAVYVHAIGTQSGRNITTTGGTALYLSANETATDGKNVEVYGYVYAYSTSHTNFNILVTSIEEYVDPNAKSINALKSSITGISAEGVTNATETGVYSLTNAADSDVTVTPDGTVVTAASISGGTLTYTVAANTGSARNGSVTLAVTGGNSITITISQLAGAGSTTTTYTKVTSAPSSWAGTYIIVYEESSSSGLVCLAGTDAYQNFTSATISSGVISSNDLADYEVEIASYSTGYSIKALGGDNANKFLEGKGSGSNGTTFAASASKVTTFSLSAGVVTITNNTNLFVYNSTTGSNGERWRFYKSGTASGSSYKKPALYKKN